MRVLHVSKLYAPWVGGVERAAQGLAEGLRANYGCHLTVICCTPLGWGSDETINGVTVARCGSVGMAFGMPLSPSFPLRLLALGRVHDVIHFHMPFPLAALGASLDFSTVRGSKIIVHYHSDIVRGKQIAWTYLPFLARLLRRANRIVVTSPNLMRSRHLQPFAHKSVMIPEPVDLRRHAKPEPSQIRRLRERFAISPAEKVVLFVGRFAYYKGLEYLVDAMRMIDVRLLLVGAGEREERIRHRVAAMGLEQKVSFAGRVPDEELGAYYSLADILVLPSVEETEAFGIVQVEAMAHGVPVVNTDLPTGVPWVSVHGETGLTVRPRDPGALADAVNTILGDENLSARFSKNAVKRVAMFDLKAVLRQVYDLYRDVLREAN